MNQGETRKTGEAEIRPPVLGDKAEGSEAWSRRNNTVISIEMPRS